VRPGREAGLVAAALLLGGAGGAAAAADPPRWRLAPGQMAVYAHFPLTLDVKTEKLKRAAERPHAVFGHRVVDGRTPRPLQPSLADLARSYALALPPEAAGGEEKVLFQRLADCGPVEASARWTTKARDDGTLEIQAYVDLRHRGPQKSDDFDRMLVDGHIAVTSVFDPARGIVASTSYEMGGRTIADEGAIRDRKVKSLKSVGEMEYRRTRDPRDADFQKDVDAAIARGTTWLKGQAKDGAWPAYDGYPGGSEALVALALFACDEERKAGADALARAMGRVPEKTYQAAVTMMAIDMRHTPPGEADLLRSGRIAKPVRNLDEAERKWMEKGAEFLVSTAKAPGRWNYPSSSGARFIPPPPDLSNSQYAVLGLLAAHRGGVPVEEGVWLGVLRAFAQAQEKDGPPVAGWFPSARQQREAEAGTSAATPPQAKARGFPYRNGEPPSGTMTCAGIGSIAIARGVLREIGKEAPPALAATAERAILDGFGWIHAGYTVEQAPHGDGRPRKWRHYYLYALERAGILADVARVNEHDWYGDGALGLLLEQDKDGWWTEEPDSAPRKIADTCFALLLLKRAVTPVEVR
jgi:hypothetical protein